MSEYNYRPVFIDTTLYEVGIIWLMKWCMFKSFGSELSQVHRKIFSRNSTVTLSINNTDEYQSYINNIGTIWQDRLREFHFNFLNS